MVSFDVLWTYFGVSLECFGMRLDDFGGQLKKYKIWDAGYLRCKKCVCFTGGDFNAFIYISVAQCEYIVLQNIHLTCFYKLDAAVAE